ncbi:MAG: hypothetical protein ACOC97_01815 [Myxococcota bacterium]
MDEAIKGAALREFLGWYARARGPVAVQQVIGDLPEEVRAWFDAGEESLGVLASSWYPAPAIHALLDRMTRDMSPAEREQFALEGSAVVMRETLSGLYRTLFRILASPDRYATFAPKVWAHYYRSGSFHIDQPEPGLAVAHVRDWRTHHPVLCDMNRGAAVVIYQGMNLRDVRVTREACVDRGEDECRFRIQWRS